MGNSMKPGRLCTSNGLVPMLITLFLLVMNVGDSAGATFVMLDSEEGHVVGRGLVQRFTPSDGIFTATHEFRFTIKRENGIRIRFVETGAVSSWNFHFAAPGTTLLGPGIFEEAADLNLRSPKAPGLGVGGEGRGCASVNGRFVVFDARYDSGGNVVSFAADFEHRCGRNHPALFGVVRFNSDVPIGDQDGDGVIDIKDNCPADRNPQQEDADGDHIGDTCDPVQGQTFVFLDSQPGDFVGGGDRRFLTLDQGFFSAIRVHRGDITIRFDGIERWQLEFEPKDGQSLGVGPFDAATDSTAGSPALQVFGDGRSCNRAIGKFRVLQAEFGAKGEVTHFAADFEQRCRASAPALFGVVRFNATGLPTGYDQDDDGIIDPADNCLVEPNPDQANEDNDEFGDACDPFVTDPENLGVCLMEHEDNIRAIERLIEENEQLRNILIDEDGDGELDTTDACPGTAPEIAVDNAGCSIEQFCAAIDLDRKKGVAICIHSDWMNDESLGKPADCAISKRKHRSSQAACVPARTTTSILPSTANKRA